MGAGDSGQELFSWASPHFTSWGYEFLGFIDDNKAEVLGKIVEYRPRKEEVFICAIAKPSTRIKICKMLENLGAHFINLIHPTAIVHSKILSKGVVISPFVYVANQVVLGDHVFLNTFSSIGHDVEVGEGSNISSHCDLTGHVKVGKEVFMGSHSCVIPKKVISDNAVIGAGSAVVKNVPAFSTVMGVPAKRLI